MRFQGCYGRPMDEADDGAGGATTAALVAGAVASAVLTAYATQRVRSPILLRVLFALWVLAPFGLLALGRARSAGWPASVARTLEAAAWTVALGSAIAYGAVAVGSARPRAPVFVLLPPLSSLAAAIAVAIAALRARSR
jgi:hypothetical protein